MNVYETLGIKARPLKRPSGETYAYVPTGEQDRSKWNDFLNLVRKENYNNAEPKKLETIDVNKVILSASADFKAVGENLYFRNMQNKQHNAGVNAYLIEGEQYNSLPDFLRKRYHIFTAPIVEEGKVVGFKAVGQKAKQALSLLLQQLS
jgi:hypothetical protein